MKFTCDRTPLLRTLKEAARVVTKNPEKKILENLHLRLKHNQLTVTATDMNLWVRSQTETTGGEAGTVVIDPQRLIKAVGSFSSDVVHFETKNRTLSITSGEVLFPVFETKHIRTKTVIKLDTLPAGNYPEKDFPKIEMEETIITTQEGFANVLRQLKTSLCTNRQLPSMLNVLVIPRKDRLRLVSTDSFRMSVCDLAGVSLPLADDAVIVPGRVLNEMLYHANQEEVEKIQIGVSETHVAFKTGSAYYVAQLPVLSYPNYQTIIPQKGDYPNCLTIDKEAFATAINQVRVTASSENKTVCLAMGNEKLVVSSKSEQGESSVEMDVSYTGEELVVGFNIDYLSDGLSICPGDTVSLYTKGERKPAVFKGEPEEGFMYILMPMTLQEGW